MFCRFCGKLIPDNVKYCPECGSDLTITEVDGNVPLKKRKTYYVSAKDRTTAILLCALGLGGFAGLHHMYVGKWKTGILYAMTLGLFFVGTAYDFYCLIYNSFKDKDGYPLFCASSMKSNYKRRVVKEDMDVLIKVLVYMIAYICFLIGFGILL